MPSNTRFLFWFIRSEEFRSIGGAVNVRWIGFCEDDQRVGRMEPAGAERHGRSARPGELAGSERIHAFHRFHATADKFAAPQGEPPGMMGRSRDPDTSIRHDIDRAGFGKAMLRVRA